MKLINRSPYKTIPLSQFKKQIAPKADRLSFLPLPFGDYVNKYLDRYQVYKKRGPQAKYYYVLHEDQAIMARGVERTILLIQDLEILRLDNDYKRNQKPIKKPVGETFKRVINGKIFPSISLRTFETNIMLTAKKCTLLSEVLADGSELEVFQNRLDFYILHNKIVYQFCDSDKAHDLNECKRELRFEAQKREQITRFGRQLATPHFFYEVVETTEFVKYIESHFLNNGWYYPHAN